MADWIEHDGNSMPVDGETLVYVKFADGMSDTHCRSPLPAQYWDGESPAQSNWFKNGMCADIVAYMVVENE